MRPNIEELSDDDPHKVYVRRVRPQDVTRDALTNEVRLIPQKSLVFNPDLSLHCEDVITQLDSTVAVEYEIPANGAISAPTVALVADGAALKQTPNDDEPVLGPAHRSLYGKTVTPSKTDKADMRDIIMAQLRWVAQPELSA